MTIEFECGHCGKQLSTTDDKAGRTGKCPDCGEPVTVPQPATGAENPFADEDRASEFVETSPSRSPRLCPMCGAQVASTDRICPSCGEELSVGAVRAGKGEFSTGNTIDPGRVISEAWKRYADQMGIAIGGMLVLGILAIIVNQVVRALLEAGPGPAFLATIGNVVYNAWIGLGMASFLLSIARGERASLSQLFSGGNWLGRGLLATLVVVLIALPLIILTAFLAVGAGFAAGPYVAILVGLMCFVGVLLILLTFAWFQYVLVDLDAAGISCISRSRELMAGNYFAVFALTIVCVLLVLAGLLMFVVGVIFTIPFAMVIWAMTYHHLSGGASGRPGNLV